MAGEHGLDWSPDDQALTTDGGKPDSLRYDYHSDDPNEAAGLMRAAMPTHVRVLDVGCGTGALTLIVNHGKGNQVIGLEPDRERAETARSRGLTVFEQPLDDSFTKEHGPFDVVIFADVLEHVAAPHQILDLAVRALNPGGMVLASVPNVAHWSVRANLLVGRFDYEDVGIMDSTHLRWFTAKTIRALMEGAGLKVESIRQSAGVALPVYSRSIFRLMPRKLLNPIVRLATKTMPRLFGIQHIVVARKP